MEGLSYSHLFFSPFLFFSLVFFFCFFPPSLAFFPPFFLTFSPFFSSYLLFPPPPLLLSPLSSSLLFFSPFLLPSSLLFSPLLSSSPLFSPLLSSSLLFPPLFSSSLLLSPFSSFLLLSEALTLSRFHALTLWDTPVLGDLTQRARARKDTPHAKWTLSLHSDMRVTALRCVSVLAQNVCARRPARFSPVVSSLPLPPRRRLTSARSCAMRSVF